MTPAGVDGEAIAIPKDIVLPVSVTVGGVEAQVIGKLLIYTGEIQVNVKVLDPSGNNASFLGEHIYVLRVQ